MEAGEIPARINTITLRIFYGIKPWGQGVDDDELLLPKQLHEINSLLVELDFDYRITNSTRDVVRYFSILLDKRKTHHRG